MVGEKSKPGRKLGGNGARWEGEQDRKWLGEKKLDIKGRGGMQQQASPSCWAVPGRGVCSQNMTIIFPCG